MQQEWLRSGQEEATRTEYPSGAPRLSWPAQTTAAPAEAEEERAPRWPLVFIGLGILACLAWTAFLVWLLLP
jgi:hypothetical protein